MGPLPRRAGEAVVRWTRRLVDEGRSSKALFDELLALRTDLRGRLARLIGATEDSVALTTATTDGCNIVLNGLGIGAGDEVVTTDSEHPGLFGGLVASGATVRIAEIRNRPAAEALAALEDQLTERTRVIAVSHVSWLTGAVLPIRELAGHRVPLLVDGAQGAGAIPVDVQELGCDFYTVSAQKWLLGPEATGALFVRTDRVNELRMAFPSYVSWELLSERADVVTEPDQATLVTWRADDPPALAARLAGSGVVVRDLPGTGWVRASCGFWTSEEDLQRLIRAI
jgi:L-cysteine/cystine lyase